MKGARGASLRSRIALLLLGSGVAFAVCEALARALLPSPSLIRFGELHIVAEGAGIAGLVDSVFERDPETFWRLRPDSELNGAGPLFGTVANSQGLRELREIPVPKPERQIRILFLGDSTSFGWGLAASEAPVRLTEAALRERFPEVDVLCINAGVPGYTAFQGWQALVERGLAYQPDLVVASFGFNDAETWGGRGDLEVYEHLQRSEPPAALAWSRVVRLFFAVLHPLPEPGAANRARLTPSEFRGVLQQLADVTSEAEIELLLWVGGLRSNVDGSKAAAHRTDYQVEQYRFAAARSFGPGGANASYDAVPLMQQLAELHGVDAVFLDHVHPTLLANRVLAERLAARIAPWLQTRIRY